MVPVGFGSPVEARQFIQSHPERIRLIQSLLATAEKTFIRRLVSNKLSDCIGFYLGRICVEDLKEIVILAGNGYGVGAQKILRGMYERAVTSVYILQNPSEADRFWNYHKVHQRKAYNHAKKLGSFGPRISPETVERIENDFNLVKSDYTEDVCKPCGKTRLMGSWTKLDTASMAERVGNGFADIYYDAFYKPTLQIHTTVGSLMSRLALTPAGRMTFKDGATRKEANDAVILAINILLRVLGSQNEHFALGLDADLRGNVEEFQKTYDPARKNK